MAATTTVFITGANRAAPNHVVITAVRDPTSASALSLKAVPTGEGSKVILVKIENSSATDPSEAVKAIQAEGITTLDVVIANAGVSGCFSRIDALDVADMRMMFEINTLSAVSLFQAAFPLLQKSANPKFVAMTSHASSIAKLEENTPYLLCSYAVSKSAVNYITRRIHFENDWLTAFVIHPGFAQTDMGNEGARYFGLPGAFVPVKDSVAGLLDKIDNATRDSASGEFLAWDGEKMLY